MRKRSLLSRCPKYYREENNHIPEEKTVLLVIRFVRDLANVQRKL
jgi:hypothetical protein